MKEKIYKNYFLSCVKKGLVVANYYCHTLAAVAEAKLRHPGCSVEAFDVSKYGFSFGDAPVIKVDGGMVHAVRCIDTGKTWRSTKECCNEMGIPLKALYTAIRRGSRVYGHRYEYYKNENEDERERR